MRFIHAADLHLDSPLSGLRERAGEQAEKLIGATRRAFEKLVDFAVDERVDFVVIAGDVFDGDWPDHGTGLFFVKTLARLNAAGIPVAMIRGNHDAASVISRRLSWPGNVREFSSRVPETWTLPDLNVAIHGQSFADRAIPQNLAAGYPDPVPGLFNIGILHTSATGRPGHGLVTLRGLTEMGSATCPSLCHYTRSFAPGGERLGSEEPMRSGGSEMARNGERVVDRCMH